MPDLALAIAIVFLAAVYRLVAWWDTVRAERWRRVPTEKRTE